MHSYSDRGEQRGGQLPPGLSPDDILKETTEVGRGIDALDADLDDLERAFRQSLARPDMPAGQIDSKSANIMASYKGLINELTKLKKQPQSVHAKCKANLGMTDRRLKATLQKYQTLEASFRRESQQAAERQYRIVRPDATDAEVREAVADPGAPIFQQAVCIARLDMIFPCAVN